MSCDPDTDLKSQKSRSPCDTLSSVQNITLRDEDAGRWHLALRVTLMISEHQLFRILCVSTGNLTILIKISNLPEFTIIAGIRKAMLGLLGILELRGLVVPGIAGPVSLSSKMTDVSQLRPHGPHDAHFVRQEIYILLLEVRPK